MNKDIKRICIICEGYEEYDYLNTLINKGVFQKNLKIKLINAKGINRIFTRYINEFQSNSHHIVLIFCDTDKEKQDPYWNLKENINRFHDKKAIANNIIIFGRPCTMQIILSHFGKISLHSPSKKVNQKIIKQLTGITSYDATLEQRNHLMPLIKRENYEQMKKNLIDISTNDREIPSTNFLQLINNLEKENKSWISEINNKL